MSRPLLLSLALLLPLPVLAAPAPAPSAAAAASPAAAAPAPDLHYRHDGADHPLLKDYDGQPWWSMLASCAGYAIAASEQPDVAPESVAAYQRDANYYATLASYRLARDRQRPLGIQPEVEQAANAAADRAIGNALVASVPQRQSMSVLCGAHVQAYDRMVPGRGLK
jgi:hypothetical protein